MRSNYWKNQKARMHCLKNLWILKIHSSEKRKKKAESREEFISGISRFLKCFFRKKIINQDRNAFLIVLRIFLKLTSFVISHACL